MLFSMITSKDGSGNLYQFRYNKKQNTCRIVASNYHLDLLDYDQAECDEYTIKKLLKLTGYCFSKNVCKRALEETESLQLAIQYLNTTCEPIKQPVIPLTLFRNMN